jgi:hypothetical protein
MISITQQQSRDRYKVIPPELQDLIFAETTADTFEHIGEENHLTKDKVYELGRIAGLVLLGFLHRDDTRKELQEALGVNPMIANELQNELNKKLFLPVADLLDKVYSPLSKNATSAQKGLDSIVPLRPVSLDNMPKAATMPSITAQNVSVPAADLKFIPSIPPASFPSPMPAAPQSTAETTTKKSPFVFTGSTSQVASQPSAPAPKPVAFVTQTGSQSAPVGNVPKFKIETPGALTGSAFAGASAPTFSSAPRPAKIELGFSGDEKKQAPKPTTTFETQKSSIRYGAPIAPAFSQIPTEQKTISAPKAPVPPVPSKIEPPKPLL